MPDDPSFKTHYLEGINKFQSARSKVFWQEALSLFKGKSSELLSFDDIKTKLRLREENYQGLQDVPLEKIVGSVGRYRDFTRDFLPKTGAMKDRWSRVFAKVSSMEGVPPIELYKVGDVYFVRDGNHRVSVARQLGSESIEAHVTELPTTIQLSADMSEKEMDSAVAYADFLEETGLQLNRPHLQSMQLSEPSLYHDLLGHIYLHARIMEQVTGEAVLMANAAADWYDNVYRPALTLIRKHGVLEQLEKAGKERTEADLFLWMVDHLREIQQQYGRELPPKRRFSEALVDYLNERKITVPDKLMSEDDSTVILSRAQLFMQPADEDEPAQE